MRIGLVFILLAAAAGAADPDFGESHKLAYNRDGLTCDLGWGLWAVPLPMDYDGDGDMDLLVSSAGMPSPGTVLFENDGTPVLRPGRVIDRKQRRNLTVSYVRGEAVVCEPGAAYRNFPANGFRHPEPVPVPPPEHYDRDCQYRFSDVDGDGVTDVVIGYSDWRDYGWDDAYDETGTWIAGPLHGRVGWARNEGTEEHPRYAPFQLFLTENGPVEVYGTPSPNLVDWDGDGDMDLVCGSFLDTLTWFENLGGAGEPSFSPGRPVMAEGAPLRLELQMLQVVAADWDGDGDPDLIVGKEDGRVVLVENAGYDPEHHMPRLKQPAYFRQQADKVKCGALATPDIADWDGDGDMDLISGNTAGFLEFIENLGGNPPRWEPPVRLAAGGEIIRFQAGPNLSIQGPAEAKWGYTIPTVADWNGDGLPDILCNTIIGKVVWFRNIGTRHRPELAPAEPVRVKWPGTPPIPHWNWWRPGPDELVIEWRTKLGVRDLNQDGWPDLIAVDHEGFLAWYERLGPESNFALAPGRRIFHVTDPETMGVMDGSGKPTRIDVNADGINDLLQRSPAGQPLFLFSDRVRDRTVVRDFKTVFYPELPVMFRNPPNGEGTLLRANGGWAGRSGRRTFVITDWDQDGRADLIMNSVSVNLWRGVDSENGHYTFRDEGPMTSLVLSGHSTCPAVGDLNGDGQAELLIGAEDGFFYWFPADMP